MMLNNNNDFMMGTMLWVIFYLIIFTGVAIMAVYGFILLVKFLRAGTKAFTLYIEKNSNRF